MASNSSYETSWADQWDPEPVVVPQKKTTTLGGHPKGKYSQKMEDGFEKTKEVASRGFAKAKVGAAGGFAKAKVGATAGVRWIKDKYHKTTRKH